MGQAFYRVSKGIGRLIAWHCLRYRFIDPHRLTDPALDRGAILAVTHVSHLEPFLVSTLTGPTIRWMARTEFYQNKLFAFVLKQALAFEVNRHGVPVSTIRTAVTLLDEQRVVGIFPEGGVAQGPDSLLRGGPAKGGACLLAQRTGKPIIPVAVVGSDRLNQVTPWLPFRRGRLWVAVGEPIHVEPLPRCATRFERRQQRRAMTQALPAHFQALYARLRQETDLTPQDLP